ncbi:hypothetical protein CB1_001024010 [Camelus ferus]|nr:hypothetical protein CB1_001024010 [Camelus ferus]
MVRGWLWTRCIISWPAESVLSQTLPVTQELVDKDTHATSPSAGLVRHTFKGQCRIWVPPGADGQLSTPSSDLEHWATSLGGSCSGGGPAVGKSCSKEPCSGEGILQRGCAVADSMMTAILRHLLFLFSPPYPLAFISHRNSSCQKPHLQFGAQDSPPGRAPRFTGVYAQEQNFWILIK